MEYQQDLKIIHKMKLKLSIYLICSYEQVTETKQVFINTIIKNYDLKEDVAEYHFVMDIADQHNDSELAELIHLYRVGYFEEDTRNYKPKSGDLYEIVNLNYLNAIDCGSNRKRAS